MGQQFATQSQSNDLTGPTDTLSST